ncbi:aspartate aminotransferase family protein [Vitreoscilla massiliensis]|uniref:Aspartate aminotransferase family protein n=1 Tax=Vitreoscilla massiliensis TaxID=1689272 RepID=A0ABY4DZY2_9NEIS|nr:aspartate aminotransferase family protein [Vitreoscilla massiliensis]UOO88685.1 aspartate aminotransferase family protein [Vitreoscilla massiliensis]
MTQTAASVQDMAHHLHPFSDNKQLKESGVRVIEKADGIYIYDNQGNKIIDGMAGLWCVNIGYGRKELGDIAKNQMDELAYYNTFFKTSHPAVINLSAKLAEVAPAGFNHVFYTGSGSESVDSMMRMVRHYWASVGKPSKTILIGRWNGYHGSTIGGASMGGMKGMHAQGGLPIPGIEHIEQPWYYGLHNEGETPEEFGLRAANWLEERIIEVGADNVAAFVGEPIQGAGGVIIPPSTYWPRIQEICQKYNILLVADEVICGFGRTGSWFGHETLGFKPDIFTTAKGLSSGYLPIGAVFVGDKVVEGILQGGEFNHGFTYAGHPVSAAVALKNVQILQDEKIIQNVHDVTGPYMQQKWREMLAQFKYVDDVRGVGLIQGFTLVKNKATREMFPNEGETGTALRDIFFRNNLIMRACGDHIVASPPLTITKEEIDLMLATAEKCIQEFEANMDAKLGA